MYSKETNMNIEESVRKIDEANNMIDLIHTSKDIVVGMIKEKSFSYSFRDILGLDFPVSTMYFANEDINNILVNNFDFINMHTPNTIQFFVCLYKKRFESIDRKDLLDKLCGILYGLMSKYSTLVESINIASMDDKEYEYFQITYFMTESCEYCNKPYRLFHVIEDIACGIDEGKYGYPVPFDLDTVPIVYTCGIEDIKEDK